MNWTLWAKVSVAAACLAGATASSGCVPQFQHIERLSLPIPVSESPGGQVNLDVVWANVSAEVESLVPGSYLVGISYRSKPQDLVSRQGVLAFDFMQVSRRLGGDRVVFVAATADLKAALLDVSASDWSDHYPNTTPWPYPGDAVFRMMTRSAAQVADSCCARESNIAISSLEEDWAFDCYPPASEQAVCHFRIDQSTGVVTRVP